MEEVQRMTSIRFNDAITDGHVSIYISVMNGQTCIYGTLADGAL